MNTRTRKIRRLPQGINTLKAIRYATAILGAECVSPRRTGEIRVKHPLMSKSVRLSHHTRRKDASRQLLCWINRLADRINEQTA